jgi:ABC-type multidrug transport system ATPase subunit
MLEIDRLGCARGGARVLEAINYSFPAASMTLVTGPNGAGKTTLLRCIAGLEPHDSGRIVHDGHVVDVGSQDWRASVAMVPDDNALFPELTAEEHVALACALAGVSRDQTQERVVPLLELFSLETYRHHWSGELSFGYRKRLAIALALVQPAAIYLLDEPLVGLDAASLDVFRSVLALLRARGKIVIVASHITAPLADIADTVVGMRDGRAVGTDASGGQEAQSLGPEALPWLR